MPAGSDTVGVVLDRTPFYAEQGGQVADYGHLGHGWSVYDCQIAAGYILHLCDGSEGTTSGLVVGDSVEAVVDADRRRAIVPNHTMTHVLNFALRSVLVDGVDQKGSVVRPENLRFDFSHGSGCTVPQLAEIETIVRSEIAANLTVYAQEVKLDLATQINGLRAVFGEQYPDPVRVVSVGTPIDELLADPANPNHAAHSIEFCGGTHLYNTADAGPFALVGEEGIAKGIRRVTAVTGAGARDALALAAALDATCRELEATADADPTLSSRNTALRTELDTAVISVVDKANLRDRVAAITTRVMAVKKAAAAVAKAQAGQAALDHAAAAVGRGESFVVCRMADDLDVKTLTQAWDGVQKAYAGMSVCFTSRDTNKGKVVVFSGVAEARTGDLAAKDWIGVGLEVLGWKGGGKPALAQGMGMKGAEDGDEGLLAEAMDKLVIKARACLG